ncbi:MAG: hypothetical protein ACOCRX_08695 [Candidatus Woesearchaeota archaeon]
MNIDEIVGSNEKRNYYRINEREDVTEKMKQIFGEDIVEKAYAWRVENEPEKEAPDFQHYLDENYDVEEGVVIQFCNGNIVRIWGSEWGGIHRMFDENDWDYPKNSKRGDKNE